MDATCWKVVGGMGTAITAMATALVILWRALQASQAARIADLNQHNNVLTEMQKILKEKKDGDTKS